MLNNNKSLIPNNYIIILARKGSTRIKNKNLRKIGGISLTDKKIKDAKKSKIGNVFLSTNSKQIKKLGYENNINVINRPNIYSSKKATTFSAILHFLRFLIKNNHNLPRYLTILPPTFPFLKISTIRKCYNKIINNKSYDSITVYSKSNSHPFTMIIKKKKKIIFDKIKYSKCNPKKYERTQDWPKVFNNCAAIRISKIEYFQNFIKLKSNKLINFTFNKSSCIGFEITKKEAIDINNLEDLNKARKIQK